MIYCNFSISLTFLNVIEIILLICFLDLDFFPFLQSDLFLYVLIVFFGEISFYFAFYV